MRSTTPLMSTTHRETANQAVRGTRAKRLCAGFGSLCATVLLGLVLCPATGPAQSIQHVGDDYLNNPLQSQNLNSTALRDVPAARLHTAELLDSGSRTWAGAQALQLVLGQDERLLAQGVIAGTGDELAVATAYADGRLRVFGQSACNATRTPENQPALALALAPRGGILAAWAQGVNDLIFYELGTTGCASTMVAAPFQGEADIALSPDAGLIAARDHSGALWLGPRGGELREVANLPAHLALLAFTDGGGTLVTVQENGRGAVWNARSGAHLRSLDIAGGPFRSGALSGADVVLRTADGTLVRWNLLRNAAAAPDEPEIQQHRAWAELRGSDLFLVSMRRAWRARPQYELTVPLLDWSAQKNVLRLHDVDGQVRYFDAKSGKPALQVFAEDWASVRIDAQGRAEVLGRAFRIFDTLPATGATDSKVNCRAVSDDKVVLWTGRAPDSEIRVAVPPATDKKTLRKVADAPLALPFRTSLEDAAPARLLHIK
jgi:hypothetical protein